MAVLKLDEQKALNLYPNSSKEFREMLENTFGEEFFKRDVTDRIKTLNDAFKATGRPKVDFSNFPEDLREYFEGQYNAVVLTEALNEGFKPDWDNWDERKYRPWFNMSPSAFGFYVSDCDHSVAVAGAGSRLCNPTCEIARYSAEQFKDVWKKVQLG